MTAKNRQKSEKSEKGEKSATNHEDAPPKKSPKSNGVTAGHQGSRSQRSGSGCLGIFKSAVFYLVLAAAVAFAGVYLHKVLDEIRQTSARNQEGAQRSGELSGAVVSLQQQVESLKSLMGGLESSLSITRADLQGAVSRMKTGEVETKRVEEALKTLQSDLHTDLSESIKEVKELQESDLSALERTIEHHMAEESQSVKASLAKVTSAQSEVQNQMTGLQALVSEVENPALIKQELQSIVNAVAKLKTAQEAEDSLAESLTAQIGSVREELQTRNKEVASLSGEVQSMRSVVQEAVGSLKQSLSEAEVDLKTLKDHRETLEGELEQAVSVAREAEKRANDAAAQARGRSDDLEARVKTSEDAADSATASIADITFKLDSLLTKYDTLESSLAAQENTVENTKTTLGGKLDDLKSQLDELQSNMSAQETSPDSALEEQVTELKRRMVSQEESSSRMSPEQLQSLQTKVLALEETTSTRLEDQEQAISSIQTLLQEATQTLEGLSRTNQETE